MMARLDCAASDLAQLARSVAQRGGWDERWIDHLDEPPQEKTYGGGIAHVITHSMHHRAQLLYILRRLGLAGLPEGDVLSWEQQAESALGVGEELQSGLLGVAPTGAASARIQGKNRRWHRPWRRQ
jgi:hypothetical protein